jgi:copper transport protein
LRTLLRLLGVAGMVILALLPAGPAAAHAVLVESQPANGATVARAPETVVLRFSEDITARFSSASLLDSAGRTVAGARIARDRSGPRLLVLDLPALPEATYGVDWRVLAEDDGHTTGGVVVFTVGNPPQSPGGPAFQALDTGSGTPPQDVARRWLGLCLLAGLIGGLAFAGLVLRPTAADPDEAARAAVGHARRRVLGLAATAGALASVAGILDLVAQAGRSDAAGPSALATLVFDTRWGHLWTTREAALVALAALALALRASAGAPDRGDRARWTVAGLVVLLLVTVEALGGHAASVGPAQTAAIAAHALTACVWLGGVAALVAVGAVSGGPAVPLPAPGPSDGAENPGPCGAVLLPAPGPSDGAENPGPSGAVPLPAPGPSDGAENPGPSGAGLAALLRLVRGRFTVLAAVSLGLVVATGLYSAGREVGSTRALVDTSYGRVLILKGALLLVAGGLGLANAARLHGWSRLAGRPSRRLVSIEAAAGVVLLLLAGILTETPPARDLPPPAAAAAAVTRTGAADDLVVSVSVTPNRPGPNGFTVLAVSGRRPPPAPVDDITLVLDGGSGAVALRAIEPGRYFGTGDLPSAGVVRATAVVRRGGARLTLPVEWSVAPAATAQPAPSGDGLAPVANALAVTVIGILLALAAWRVAAARRRRRVAVPEAETAQAIPQEVR